MMVRSGLFSTSWRRQDLCCFCQLRPPGQLALDPGNSPVSTSLLHRNAGIKKEHHCIQFFVFNVGLKDETEITRFT